MIDLVVSWGREISTHVVIASVILAMALAAASWIRPVTARTRYAILAAGLAAFLVPSAIITRAIERSGATVPLPLRGALPSIVVPATPAAAAPAFSWTSVAVVLWLGVAAALLLRSMVITRRLLANALRAGSAPPRRTIEALEAARHRLGLRTSIDLIASPLCEAPAVARVLRPIIVLPADGCQSLDDDELESLLCHECAHVARRDNLFGLFEAIAGALFWFNPLVWIARRRIAAAREEACDERVADAAMPAETYVGALAKICRSLIAPRVTAVSCMANAHLKERIEHLMKYDTLRTTALSHRLTSTAATVLVALFIIGAGIVTANPSPVLKVDNSPYQLNYAVSNEAGMIVLRTRIVDAATNEIIGEPALTTKPGGIATGRVGTLKDEVSRDFAVTVNTSADGKGTLTLVVSHDGAEIQRTERKFQVPEPTTQPKKVYTGEPISLNLADADIRDVLNTFSQLTGLEISVAPNVNGKVTVHFTNTPWDEAFEIVLRQNGLTWRMEGKKIEVYRP